MFPPRTFRAKWLTLVSVIILAGLVILNSQLASAHESRDVVAGKYQLRVGFVNEPVYQGLENGLYLGICTGSCKANPDGNGFSNGVTGAFDTLQAEVIFAEKSMELTLLPVPRQPGRYNALFVPTRVGDYTFHLFGTIQNAKIDERFTSSPNTFDSVQPLASVQFPDKPGFNDQSQAIATTPGSPARPTQAAIATPAANPTPATSPAILNPPSSSNELQTLQKKLAEQQQQLESARSSANSATTTALASLGFGIIGLAVAVTALLLGRRNRTGPRQEAEGG